MVSNKKEKCIKSILNCYTVKYALASAFIITGMLPLVDEIEGIRGLPDWVRVGPLIILIFFDFPSLIIVGIFGGIFWPETIPTMIWPGDILEALIIVVIHVPSILFWALFGRRVAKKKGQTEHLH
jgi:hypothetical protein